MGLLPTFRNYIYLYPGLNQNLFPTLNPSWLGTYISIFVRGKKGLPLAMFTKRTYVDCVVSVGTKHIHSRSIQINKYLIKENFYCTYFCFSCNAIVFVEEMGRNGGMAIVCARVSKKKDLTLLALCEW